jgi:polysaccharide pyruvyl transferase WcaK-like protein
VPAVSIAYSDKFAGVMQTLGAELLVADARKRDQTEILRTVDQAFEGRREMRRQLELKIPHVRARVLGIFKEAGYQHRDSCSIETNNAKHSQKTVDRIHSPT